MSIFDPKALRPKEGSCDGQSDWPDFEIIFTRYLGACGGSGIALGTMPCPIEGAEQIAAWIKDDSQLGNIFYSAVLQRIFEILCSKIWKLLALLMKCGRG